MTINSLFARTGSVLVLCSLAVSLNAQQPDCNECNDVFPNGPTVIDPSAACKDYKYTFNGCEGGPAIEILLQTDCNSECPGPCRGELVTTMPLLEKVGNRCKETIVYRHGHCADLPPVNGACSSLEDLERDVDCPCCTSGPGDPEDCDDTEEGEEHCDDNTPIVIGARGNRLRLTSPARGVNFDLNANGIPERISWTRAEAGDAFLALDRNANGTIDDGSELFGDRSQQPPSESPNGFLALAVFDEQEQGGNSDGRISARDAVFSTLLLWIDSNHDGQSQPGELTPIENSSIAALQLDYRESMRTDEHGNQFRYWSRLELRQPRRSARFAVDVILRRASSANVPLSTKPQP